MKKILCASILLASSGVFAAAITAVNSGVAANGYQIIFKNAGTIPTAFNINNPASIVLDFPQTTSALATRETVIGQNGVASVNVIQGDNRTRAVLNLSKPMTYNVQLVGQDVIVTVPTSTSLASASIATANSSNSSTMFKPAPVPTNVQPIALSTKPVAVPSQSTNISTGNKTGSDLQPMFHKNGTKGGVFSFTLPSKDAVVTLKTEGSTLVATISGYSVPKHAQKRLDVADYQTPVRYIDIMRKGANTRLAINMGTNAYEYVTYQNGNTYNIEINKPSSPEDAQKLKELSGFGPDKHYSGAPLSLNFQDIEVRAVLQIIAEFTNNNIVVSDSVTGNITLRLDNVPWDQALDIIMKTKGLAMRKVNHVIYIAPETELNNMEIEALKAWREKQSLEPSTTEMIQLKYAKATDIAKIIEDSRNFSRSTGNNNSNAGNEDAILSSKGSVSVDTRTNTLLVSDIPSKIEKVRQLVSRLDEPVRQVLVDSRLVITDDTYQKDLGAKFGLTFTKGDVIGSGNLTKTTSLGGGLKGGDPTIADRLGVNLPVSNTTANPASYALSILSSDILIDLELQALQAEGRSEIISSPRVVTQDGYKAVIASGQDIPYTTVSDKGTNIEFKDAKLSMEVTPRIAPNDRVSMEINITKDNANYARSVNGLPPLDTNEVQTKVEVENGETIVLGGIYEQRQTQAVNKVPLLGDLPIVGGAFRNTNKIFNKSELLIFITPRIIEQQLSSTDKFSNLRD